MIIKNLLTQKPGYINDKITKKTPSNADAIHSFCMVISPTEPFRPQTLLLYPLSQ